MEREEAEKMKYRLKEITIADLEVHEIPIAEGDCDRCEFNRITKLGARIKHMKYCDGCGKELPPIKR